MIPDWILRDVVYLHLFSRPSVGLINGLTPDADVRALANQVVSPRAALEVVRGCDGSGLWFLLAAAMLAFPATWRMKLIGVFSGAILIYWLNLSRLVGLYFVVANRPAWFVPLHTYFVPTLLIVITSLFFMVWAVRAGPCDGISPTS